MQVSTEITNIENFYNAPSTLNEIDFEMISSSKQTFNSNGREVDGIEILYNMAKSGKIDPWNIDLADLADKYLIEVAKLKTVNLKHTGRTILFLSVLLKLKSNVLEGIDVEQIIPEEENTEEFYEEGFEPEYEQEEPINRNNVISIDEVLQRRTSVRLNRNRVVTLKDLIRQLEFYEQMDKKRELKNKIEQQRKRIRSYARFSSKDIADMYNEDYIKSAIPKMKENLDRIFEQETKVELETLTLLGFAKTTAYLALLFIVANYDYDISQENFYDKLYVEKYNKVTELQNEQISEVVEQAV